MSKDKQPKDPAEQGKEIKTAADLKQEGNNYRKHSDTNKARIKKSIDEAGLGRSVVVDADGVLIAGNGVQQVVDPETPVRVVETDGTELVVVKRTDLHTDDPRRKTLALADNATADDVEWDFEAIAEDWTQDEAGEWGVEWPADEEEIEQQEAQIEQKEAQEDDFDPDKPVETVCKEGDIWKLGNHRLMCGDSTDAESVALLMDGEKADMCFTDPPYKIESGGGGESDIAKSLTVQKSDIDFISGFDPTDFLKILPTVFDKNMNAYVFCNKDLLPQYLNWAVENGYGFNVLIWKKPSAIPIKDAHRPDIEYLLFFRKKAIWNHSLEGVNYSRCLEYSRVQRSEENGNHPTPKPIALIGNELQISSNKGSVVLDLFGGSGTTLIAAEQLNRKCYMMELDPHYCDVIIARWEKLTGNKAEKLK